MIDRILSFFANDTKEAITWTASLISVFSALIALFSSFLKEEWNDFIYRNEKLKTHYYNKNRNDTETTPNITITPEISITNQVYKTQHILYGVKIYDAETNYYSEWLIYDSSGAIRYFPFILKPKETYLLKQSWTFNDQKKDYHFGFQTSRTLSISNPSLKLILILQEKEITLNIPDLNKNQYLN